MFIRDRWGFSSDAIKSDVCMYAETAEEERLQPFPQWRGTAGGMWDARAQTQAVPSPMLLLTQLLQELHQPGTAERLLLKITIGGKIHHLLWSANANASFDRGTLDTAVKYQLNLEHKLDSFRSKVLISWWICLLNLQTLNKKTHAGESSKNLNEINRKSNEVVQLKVIRPILFSQPGSLSRRNIIVIVSRNFSRVTEHLNRQPW